MIEADEAACDGLQANLLRAVQPSRWALTSHDIYRRLDDLERVRDFMASHVFAVWDFMSLLKTLQQRLTCISTPWVPPPDPLSARLINEIVLAEESDQLGDGFYASHFELYLDAMSEVGADRSAIDRFLRGVRAGRAPAQALAESDAPGPTRPFVMTTLNAIKGQTHEVAASFLLGREALIPAMFERMLSATAGLSAPRLTWYLTRHIQIDGDEHGPAAFRLLRRLCGTDPTRWLEAERAAHRALLARRALWDGVCDIMDRPKARANKADPERISYPDSPAARVSR
jgi:hypothetical protein